MATGGPAPPTSNYDDENLEIGIFATAKRMGLSFEELNLFNLNAI